MSHTVNLPVADKKDSRQMASAGGEDAWMRCRSRTPELSASEEEGSQVCKELRKSLNEMRTLMSAELAKCLCIGDSRRDAIECILEEGVNGALRV